MIKYITDDLKLSSDESDESDEEQIKIKNLDGVLNQIYLCKTIICQTGGMYTTNMCGVIFQNYVSHGWKNKLYTMLFLKFPLDKDI